MVPKVITSTVLLATKWFRVMRDDLKWPDGSVQDMHFAEKGPAVCIIAIYDGTIVLVEQYRHTEQKRSLEIPMGGIEKGETPEHAARREMEEETGFHVGSMWKIGSFFPANGYMRQSLDVFVAEGLREGSARHRDASEKDLRVLRMPLGAWKEKIRAGEITCGPSLGAWAIYREFKEESDK